MSRVAVEVKIISKRKAGRGLQTVENVSRGFITAEPSADVLQRLWEAERAFNELTSMRMHVNLSEAEDEEATNG